MTNEHLTTEFNISDLATRLAAALRDAGEILQCTGHDDAVFAAESVASDLEFSDEIQAVIKALRTETTS